MKRHFLILSEIDNSLRYWLRTLISSFYYRSACTVSDPTKKLSKLSTFLQLKNSKTVDKNISSQPKSTFFRKVSKSLKSDKNGKNGSVPVFCQQTNLDRLISFSLFLQQLFNVGVKNIFLFETFFPFSLASFSHCEKIFLNFVKMLVNSSKRFFASTQRLLIWKDLIYIWLEWSYSIYSKKSKILLIFWKIFCYVKF